MASKIKISMLVLLLVLMFLPVVHAQDYLGEGRLTKRTPEMERTFDNIYERDPENYLFNALEFSKNYLKPERWTVFSFISAKESFEKGVGTCTEISVLYCAMMRYKGIPCTFRIIEEDNDHGVMFPVVYLESSWYYPQKIWINSSRTYWTLLRDSDVMKGTFDRTNEFDVEEW